MCGIFGICYGPGGAAGEDWSPSELAQICFPAIIHRGPHAYGWMSYNPDTGITVEKHKGRCDTQTALETMDSIDNDASWLVGHVRFATHGSPDNPNNNHPLVHGNIVGVHNGVLRNHESILKETGREKADTQVDSEAIFAAVHKHGIRGGLAQVEGDMVTVFTSTKSPATLRIGRSHGRPLVYATTAAGSLIFASERCVLDAPGIEMGPQQDLTGRNRLLTVRNGRITERTQYKAAPAATPTRAARPAFSGGTSLAPRAAGEVPVKGITDYYDALANVKSSPKRRPSGGGTSGGPIGTLRDGGRYLGSGRYLTGDGRAMNVDEYVDYRVEQALASIRNNETPEV